MQTPLQVSSDYAPYFDISCTYSASPVTTPSTPASEPKSPSPGYTPGPIPSGSTVSVTNNCKQDIFVIASYFLFSSDRSAYARCVNDGAFENNYCIEYMNDEDGTGSGQTVKTSGTIPAGEDAYVTVSCLSGSCETTYPYLRGYETVMLTNKDGSPCEWVDDPCTLGYIVSCLCSVCCNLPHSRPGVSMGACVDDAGLKPLRRGSFL